MCNDFSGKSHSDHLTQWERLSGPKVLTPTSDARSFRVPGAVCIIAIWILSKGERSRVARLGGLEKHCGPKSGVCYWGGFIMAEPAEVGPRICRE